MSIRRSLERQLDIFAVQQAKKTNQNKEPEFKYQRRKKEQRKVEKLNAIVSSVGGEWLREMI